MFPEALSCPELQCLGQQSLKYTCNDKQHQIIHFFFLLVIFISLCKATLSNVYLPQHTVPFISVSPIRMSSQLSWGKVYTQIRCTTHNQSHQSPLEQAVPLQITIFKSTHPPDWKHTDMFQYVNIHPISTNCHLFLGLLCVLKSNITDALC